MHDRGEEQARHAFADAVGEIAGLEAWDHWAEDPKVARSLLARLYHALSGAPQGLRDNRVEGYVESTIDADVQQIGAGLDIADGWFWPDLEQEPIERIFDSAFVAMRYLDEALSQQPVAPMPDTLDEFETDTGYYVVPCRKITGGRERMTGQGLSRRGLLYHRIAPMHHDGMKLALHLHPDVGLAPDQLPPVRRVGAAVFPGLELDTVPSAINKPGNFLITGVRCDTPQEQTVAEQFQAAAGAKCDTLIWPELTMPPQRVNQVRALLRDTPLGGAHPPLVVTGSWHEAVGQRHRNRGWVLDGRGEPLLCFDKCLAFMVRGSPAGSAEDIEPGDTVHLLWAGDELIVFQICLGFCHLNREALLRACDGSLMIVPSMGEGSTIRNHMSRAERLQTSNNARTVVVQQELNAPKNAPFGYILPGPAKPREYAEKDTLTSQQFSSFYTDGEES